MKDKTFEELFDRYKEISESLEDEDIKLDDLISLYQESDEIYNKLCEYINDAKVKIENTRENNV